MEFVDESKNFIGKMINQETRLMTIQTQLNKLLTKIENSEDEIMVLKNENKSLREQVTQLQREVL
jgi:capsule polysaccharide export protein KpsE/RkpR